MKNWRTESKQGKEYTYPYIQTTSHPPSRLLLLPSSSPISNTVFSQQQTLQPWITTSGTSQVPPTAALCTHLLLHHRPTLCTTDLRDTLRSVANRFSLRRRETPRLNITHLLLLHVSLVWSRISNCFYTICGWCSFCVWVIAGLGIKVTLKPEYRITPPVSKFSNFLRFWYESFHLF